MCFVFNDRITHAFIHTSSPFIHTIITCFEHSIQTSLHLSLNGVKFCHQLISTSDYHRLRDTQIMSANHSSNQTIAEDIVPEDKYPEMDESESDVVFVIDGHRIPAAKGIFGFKSRVFRAMFAEPFAESTASEVAIDDPMVTVDAFKAMRRFIYTEEVVLSGGQDLDEVCAVMRCAHKYQILRLVDKIADKMAAMLDIHNVKTIAEMAAKYENKPLMDSVNAFFLKYSYLLINKDMDYLKALNDMTGGQCLEAMVKSMLKTRRYFVDSVNSRSYMASPQKVTKTGGMYSLQPTANPPVYNFDFNDMSIDPKY